MNVRNTVHILSEDKSSQHSSKYFHTCIHNTITPKVNMKPNINLKKSSPNHLSYTQQKG